jgi:hypothetical protein
MLVLTFVTAQLLRTVDLVIAALPAQVDASIARESLLLRSEIRATREATERQIEKAVLGVLVRVDSAESVASFELERLRVETLAEVAALRQAVEPVTVEAAALLAEYRKIPNDFKYATSQIWDCEANPDCLENRYVSVSRAVEGSARAVERTAPQIAENVDTTASNVERITRPDHIAVKTLKVLGPLLGGVILGALR